MKPNKVKRTLKEGGTVIGTMTFEFCTPGIARLSAEAGAEFIMYDMEHTGWSVETVRDLIAHYQLRPHRAVCASASDPIPLHRPRPRRGCPRRHGADG